MNQSSAGEDTAEKALRDIETRYACLVQHSPVCIHEIDLEARLTCMNPKGLEMMGVEDFAAVRGTSYFDAVGSPDRLRIRELFARAVRGESVEFEFSPAGAAFDTVFASNFIPICDDRGDVVRLMGITEDVSARRATEKRLRQSEERYRTVIEAAPVGYWLTSGDAVVLDVNAALCRMLGRSREALLADHPCAFAIEEDRSWLRDNLVVAGSGRGGSREVRLVHDDGSIVVTRFEITSLPRSWGGGARSFSLVTDITEERAREAELLQARKMEAVGQLTGGVAHDFNNLLTVIVGSIELMELGLDGDGGRGTLLDRVKQAAARGADLTQQLLSFSRRQTLQPQVIDVGAHIDGMLDMLRRTLGEHIRIESTYVDSPLFCFVDPGQLASALLNLSINARDAMAEGGLLRFATRRTRLTGSGARKLELKAGDYVVLEVSDSGSGMSPSTASQAFEPFFTTKPPGSGSGLGLSMVFGFAKQSGGHARLESDLGEGAVVQLFLPITSCRADTPPEDEVGTGAPATAPAERERILVLEDDPQVLAVLVKLLTSVNYDVLNASTGDAAVKLLAGHDDIDLLLTDLRLPGSLSGPEVGKTAMEMRPGIKVVYMTGYVDAGTLSRAGLDPRVPLIGKPFRIEEVQRLIREVLKRTS